MSLLNLIVRKPTGRAEATAMKPPLPPSLLADLLGVEASRRRRLDDRRRRPRVGTSGKLAIVADFRTGRHTIGAQLRDLSAEGISLDVSIPLQPGTAFTLSMPRMSGDRAIEMTFVVRRCLPSPQGRHVVGAELIQYRIDPPTV